MEVEKLLLELVKIPSESGNEKKLGEFIVKRLKKKFVVKIQEVDSKKGNFNILAYIGTPKVILNAHLDTVSGQLKVKQDSKYIYGRGSCDTKASIATMIISAEELVLEGIKDFGLLFNVEEETSFNGIKKALSIIPKPVEMIIVGEPTNLDIIYGQNGLTDFIIFCKGKTAHGSTPENGINAIELLISEITKIKAIRFPKNKVLGNNIINLALISGGIADNVVPDYAQAKIVIRNSIDSKKLASLIKKQLKFSQIKIKPLEPIIFPEFINLAKKFNLKARVVPYFTEMYFLSRKAKTFIFGPGDIKYAHSKNEKVAKIELTKAVIKYKEIITLINNQALLNQKEITQNDN